MLQAPSKLLYLKKVSIIMFTMTLKLGKNSGLKTLKSGNILLKTTLKTLKLV